MTTGSEPFEPLEKGPHNPADIPFDEVAAEPWRTFLQSQDPAGTEVAATEFLHAETAGPPIPPTGDLDLTTPEQSDEVMGTAELQNLSGIFRQMGIGGNPDGLQGPTAP
ncbi:MAG TPA: hypothetical protein VK674_04070 [Candidatus Limnocylindria bacterium]|nr:hypothetical protein [Candidatus Limnocylindria bacterium]